MTDYGNIETRIRIGSRLAEIRKSKSVSMLELTEKTGLKRSTIWRVETGKFPATLDTLSKIAEALGCKIEVIEKDEAGN